MNTKLEAAILPISLLLLAVLVCPQTALAQTGYGVQSPSGFHSNSALSVANTAETNNTVMQPPAGDITQQNQMPLMIVIIVAAFAAYIAVIAVLASKKLK